MRTSSSFRLIAGLVVAGLVMAVCPLTHAAAPAGAQLVLTGVNGSQTAGSTNLAYYLNLSVTSIGQLTAKATIKGKSTVDRSKWKATFPILTNNPAIGIAVATSDVITVPSNFQGAATLQVTAYYDGKKIGKQKLLLTIGAAVTTPAAATTNWYDVGFNTNVTVNADAVSTNGWTAPITYLWSITDTDVRTNATFTTTNNIAAPKFNTLPITSFTNQLEVTSGGVTNVLDPIDLDKEFDLPTNPNLVGITTEQVDKSTYHLRVIVADAGANVATGTVTVITCSPSPGQPSIPIGERQYFTAEPNGTNASAYAWTLVGVPTNSAAVLEKATTRTPALRPDKEGDYTVRLVVTGGGQTNTSYTTVRGATYLGVATCASCHGTSPQVGLDDRVTPWSQTGHATMAQRGVDGFVSSHYAESCLPCHTLGHNKSPVATNGNFYAVQQIVGWTFPALLQSGNYAAMPAALQNVANIQCESCHGPGSQHPGEESTSLDVAVCATCHQDGNHHNRPKQWRLGPHGNDDNYLEASIEEAASASCAKCHSPTSFVDNLEGKALTRLEAGRLTCQACHDPHNMAGFPEEAHQVRIYDTVTLDDSVGTPVTLTGQGTSALCMFCHNARRSPPATYISSGSNGTRVPHESTATEALLGLRASTNVQAIISGATNTIATVTLENSAHAGVAKCVDCHMYQGSDTVGDHTFSMTDRLTDEGNIASCQQCHAGVDDVTDLDHISVVRSGFPNAGDYDGNGTTEGVQTEVAGLITILTNKMAETGMSFSTNGSGSITSSSYSTNTLTRAVQRNAAWNYWLINRELSHGVHNTAFTVRLLQWSYTVLSTNTSGNAYIVDFPSADLR